jgi:hypothetical protein
MLDMFNFRFPRMSNSDGTFDSRCSKCFAPIARHSREADLDFMLHRTCFVLVLCCLSLVLAQPASAQSGSEIQPQAAPVPIDPELKLRPSPKRDEAKIPEGLIHLDVLVTDASGKPVSGLERKDFTLLDDLQEQRIVSFRKSDGLNQGEAGAATTLQERQPPVQVILLIDTVNLPFEQVAFVRQQIAKYLDQNGGHLGQPTSIFLLSDSGLKVQPQPTVDGSALECSTRSSPVFIRFEHPKAPIVSFNDFSCLSTN